jgi:hypothetical protein
MRRSNRDVRLLVLVVQATVPLVTGQVVTGRHGDGRGVGNGSVGGSGVAGGGVDANGAGRHVDGGGDGDGCSGLADIGVGNSAGDECQGGESGGIAIVSGKSQYIDDARFVGKETYPAVLVTSPPILASPALPTDVWAVPAWLLV